ncbi:uncharacterized protein ACLA_059390 [Aspergillus clavatus NRRL 1]|uniref:Uncharacterized protein n=1 Tax=Aspergillus clavatus (strain ATCC 1007 / CBS 513.65 / DSM 816 / NCTC 3887 / NRRL 1 / QM 1276 / 107) TaxID=344612 RepID=A1C4D5_ASPCL|nr:uncharacterized protein ACLA_059390 [Aspergillus clavatus NRRL 1]EAW15275.1 hypothetical protein ACLA_059390 [Aspergillus clavatus NRRL 1]
MTKNLSFDVYYSNELAHEQFGDDKSLIEHLRDIYDGEDLVFPDTFEHSDTTPPVQYLTVEAPDDMTVEELYEVEVPRGLMVRIEELPQ